MLLLVERLQLPDWWICAGVLRSMIWNVGVPSDVDVVYFDRDDQSEDTEKYYESCLRKFSNHPWSVKNQARMQIVNDLPPYPSAREAIAQFPETVTAIGVTKRPDFELFLPYGAEDYAERIIRPTPAFRSGTDRHAIFKQRVHDKGWNDDPSLQIRS
ncbi:nucleotidyltransferase family protein [Exiguobacterium sp. TDN 0502]|uniref:nucleotidyltransferase family protein n=1 Tax=Exiguobacterium sp. TDN 0502 TaxID=3420731 RepID=UPI003D77FADB